MKKSEILQFLSEKKCNVSNFYKDKCMLVVKCKYLSGSDIVALNDKGFITFISSQDNMLLLEIAGYIEWD